MLRLDFKGLPLGCTSSLGLENSQIIPDSQITSSSFWTDSNSVKYLAIKGRLYGSSSWCSGINVNTEYIQVDLGQVKTVTGIATQGSPAINAWVTSYKVSYSFDNTNWNDYKGQVVKIFEGNANSNDVRVNWLRHPIAARYVRIYPQTRRNKYCLRFDLYGCDIFTVPKVILDTADFILPSNKGSSRTLTCSVLGEPAPDIQWFNNGAKINGATQSTLQVQFISAEDVVSKYNCTRQDPNTRTVVCNTFYKCKIVNPVHLPSGGMKETTLMKLAVYLNVPRAPTMTAQPHERSITLRWTAMTSSDDVGDLISYTIQLHNHDGSIVTFNAEHPAFNYSIDNLKPYTNYRIRMSAISAVGQGLWSSWFDVSTLIAACENLPLGMESGTIQDGNITASSARYPAKNARLHYTSGSSWCASTGDSDPYLQIDLGSSHLICAVATQGNSKEDQWVRTYQINTSTDGTTWTTYQENNIDRIFYGNYDRSTVVRRVLYHGVITRYLRIVPKTYQTDTPCLRTEIYGYPSHTSCSSHSVGIPSTSLVPDHRFTATSYAISPIHYLPSKGRLGGSAAWVPLQNNNPIDYLQVDLGAVFYVCAVATQGAGVNGVNEYVKKYEVLYSLNNVQWTTYHTNSGGTKFSGNYDRTTVVTNAIANPFRARFVRVRPTDFQGWKMLRLDFKGLPLGCTSSLGLENSQIISDSQITSSSFWTDNNGVKHLAIKGRLYGSLSWCSAINVNTEYIKVDLGQVKTVTGIATQGNPAINAWVTSYKVGYSFDNTHWNEYKEGLNVKIFEGNANRNDVRVNWLRHPIAARYLRINPQTRNSGGRQCLRFDLYGCDIFTVPKVILDSADLILPSIKGSSRTLTCSVLGEPAPDIQWFNNGTKINGATQSTLQVQFISAEEVVSKSNCTRQDPSTRAVVCNTFHTCKIVNPVQLPSGGIKETTPVKVVVFLNVTKAPTVATATPNKRSVTLSWTAMNAPDDVGTITSYTIQLSNQSGSTTTYEAHHPALDYSVDNLKPYTNYSIRMNAISAAGQGFWSSWLNVRTLIAEPEGVPSITETNVLSSQSIQLHFQYSQLDLLHGPMAGFRIFYKPEGGSQQQIDVDNVNNATLTNLKKYTEYSLSVAVRNTLYVGPPSSVMRNKTLEDAPDSEPQNTTSTKINETTFLVTWQPLSTAQSNGAVTKYEIFWALDLAGRRSRRSLQEMLNATTQATQHILYDLKVCANYIVSVRGYTSVGPGPKSTINILTSSKDPEKPTDVVTSNPTKASIEVKWEIPSPISMVVYEYAIEVKGSKSYWPKYSFSKTYTQNGAQTNMVIDGLVPGTTYEFWVMVTAACGTSQKSAPSKIYTRIDNPGKPKGKPVTLKDKFNVSLWPVDPINGPISSYQVIVIKGDKNPSNLPTNISDHKDGKELYITAELKPDEFKSSFAVGDNGIYGQFKNVPLNKGKTYTIAERAITNQGEIYAGQAAVVATIEVTQAQKEGNAGNDTGISPAGPVAGAVVVVLLILTMVVLILLIKRRLQKRDSRKESRVKLDDIGDTVRGNVNDGQEVELAQNYMELPTVGASVSSQDDIYEEAIEIIGKPIPIRQFAEYVKSTKATEYARLKEEYKKIQNTHSFPITVAKKPVNKKKNRYGNAIPYDHSRVTIERTEGDEDSDYINACYITGFDGTKRKYIAAQGPVEQTFADFWQMIWEQNTSTIVMLTKLREMGKTKCHQYWPESSETYRHITVKIHKTEVFSDYIIRTFLLKKTNSEEKRYALHFQFTVWPDKGVPNYATAVLALRRKVRSMNPQNSGPIVIHCSAGVGRTGCYIVIDAMLEQAKKLRNVDIVNYVTKIRKDRTSMVQTDEQYVFIHMAIMESLTCGNTEIQAINLQATMHKLSTANPQKNATGYALEFQRLNAVTSDYAEEECDVGRSDENASKNRYPEVVALNQSRVKLMREDTEKTDYINASFADAYRERNAFIITQAPLQNTIEDFWIMAVNYDIRTIVMLNTLEDENEQFPQYWPHEGSEKYGEVTVHLQNIRDVGASREVVARTLQVSYKSSSVRVQHLQHLKWADKCIPDKPQTVLELLNEVEQSQRQTNNATPFVVQCSNGVGRSGTLCAIFSILERMKQEQVIDVFQVVKCIRSSRPGAVESLAQYAFCYQIIQTYLDSFSDYANFSDC